MPGDKVKVDKLIFGARIYKSLDFTDGRLECWRTRGRRGLRPNDIIVFNYPVNDGKIGFKINYVYVKRCVALPGDTISFVHSRPVNNNYHGTIGVPDMQQQLESVPDDQLPWGRNVADIDGRPALGMEREKHGAALRARRDDIIRMDDWRKADIYRMAIEFETRKPLIWDGERNVCLSGGKPLLLPVPKELLLRMRGPCRQLTRLALLGLRAGRIHRGRSIGSGGIHRPHYRTRTQGTRRTEPALSQSPQTDENEAA